MVHADVEQQPAIAVPAEGGRKCEVHGHQQYWRGTCFGFATVRGQLIAIVEDEQGRVSMVGMDLQWIVFLDHRKVPYEF